MTNPRRNAPKPGAHRSLPSNDGAEPGPDARLVTHAEILDLIARNASLTEILQVVTAMVEREISGSRASILLLDDDGRLHATAGPSLPAEYHRAIDNTPIGPNVGTCGTAAFERRVVITPDVSLDPSWARWLPAAQACGIAACWSTPFLGVQDRVLGTVAVYFTEPREPSKADLALLHDAGYLTAVAVQHDAVRTLLRDTSRTNPLTGIANRVVVEEELAAVEAAVAVSGRRFAVIQVAVEGMSPINETLGPTVGDEVLRTVARRLTEEVGDSGLAAHLWGCDFVAVLRDLDDDAQAVTTAEKMAAALAVPFDVDGMSLVIGASLGVAGYGSEVLDQPRPIDEPLRAANVALERAKAAGRHQIGVFDRRSDPGAGVLVLAPELRRGMDQQELTVEYQPIVTLADHHADHHVDHYEALLRWNTPSGAVPPDAFVSVAEQTGLVGDLGRYALTRALAELSRQRAAGNDIGISVNLSVRQLSDGDLPEVIADLIAEHDVPPGKVTMEVTEGVLLTTSAPGWETLARIKETGVRIALDDFGTGFSQLSYLRRYRFDEIKIDRSFVRDIDSELPARAIISGILAFANTAHLTSVAEGIERPEQADLLRDMGCTHGQGFLFGAPKRVAAPQ